MFTPDPTVITPVAAVLIFYIMVFDSVNEKPKFSVDWKGLVKKRLPLVAWLPQYTLSKFFQDVLAGFTVSLTVIPQSIACAVIAGVEPQYGLYSGIMGACVYFLLGTCKDMNIGPTAIMALMIQEHVAKMGPDMAILMAFISGCIIFLMGLLHLGFIVEFFSFPVIAGFTSAAAIEIGSSQINNLLGLPGRADTFIETWENVINNIAETSKWDAILGATTMVVLTAMKQLRVFGSRTSRQEWSTSRNILGKVIWLLSVARNAVVVLAGMSIAWVFYNAGKEPFRLTGDIGRGFPPVQLPPFSTEFNNQTYNFGDMLKQLGTSIIFVPLIALLEHIAIGKTFAKGKTIDATQEMMALGLGNLLGSFISSMPVTGSFTRTAVNNASGVQTTLGGLVTIGVILLALGLLTDTFFFIPKATLAAVLICAIFSIIEFEAVITLWRTRKIDLIPFAVTLIVSLLLGLEYGILIGIVSNLVFVLYSSARPPVEIEYEKLPQGDVYVVTPSRSLQFPSAEYIREKIIQNCDNPHATVILNGKYIRGIDATVAKNFKVLADDLILRNQTFIFWNFKRSVMDMCVGIDKKLVGLFREGSIEEILASRTSEETSQDVGIPNAIMIEKSSAVE